MRTFCLNRKGSKIGIIAVVMAMGVTLGLTACNNGSSSASDEDYEQSSSSVACTAELEGETQLVWEGNAKYGAGRYEKCVKGEWSKVATAEVKCPKDASVGDTCYVEEPLGFFYHYPVDIYVFTEEGTWRYQDPNACSEVHEGQVYTVSPNNPKYEPVTYKKCKNGTWVSVPEASAKCEMENIQIGDTCSYEVSGSYMSSSHGITYCSVEVYQGDDLWKSVHYGLCDTLTVEK